MIYPTSELILSRLAAVADAHPAFCTMGLHDQPTVEGRQLGWVTITTPGEGERIPVLFTGGMHAREWAPPGALVSLVEKLVDALANDNDVVLPMLTDRDAVYKQRVVKADRLAKVFEKVALTVLPCVNPDGRDFSVTGPVPAHHVPGVSRPSVEMMWRKNRSRPHFSRPRSFGVDINRNFPIGFEKERYYTRQAEQERVSGSSDPRDEDYRGQVAGDQVEAQLLMRLVEELEPRTVVDVHMEGRKIVLPWGLERNQAKDPKQHAGNNDFDRKASVPGSGRDGPRGPLYGEYMPAGLNAALLRLGKTMADAILTAAGPDGAARSRSVYTPQQAAGIYCATGMFPDWVMARFLAKKPRPKALVRAVTLEAGLGKLDPLQDDGDYWPNATQYVKVEREIHAALLAVLTTTK